MSDDQYWQLDMTQLYEWLTIKGRPLERDGVRNTRIPDLPIEDIRSINQIVDPFRSKRPGTDEGGPVIYPSIDSETAGRARSGYCWFIMPKLN